MLLLFLEKRCRFHNSQPPPLLLHGLASKVCTGTESSSKKSRLFHIFFKLKKNSNSKNFKLKKFQIKKISSSKNFKFKCLHTGSAPTESSCEKSRLFFTCKEENKGVAQKDPGSSKKLQYFWRTFRIGFNSQTNPV